MPSSHAAREVGRSAAHVNHSVTQPMESVAYQQWAAEQTLHVAAAYSNPCRYWARTALFHEFRRHMEQLPHVKLYVGELAYGDRPFEVTSGSNPRDFQWRTRHELWHKENLLNLVIRRFEPGWEYGAWCDGDFHFTRHDVAIETVNQLQHYDWVQMFHSHSNLGPNHEVLGVGTGFVAAVRTRENLGKDPHTYAWPGSPGGAWAFRRNAFALVGGLLDTCILGAGDYFATRALMQIEHEHPELYGCGEPYARSILAWHRRAAVLRANVGYVDCHAVHHFHGPIRNRGYNWRWQILRDNHFDPACDVYPDHQGVYQLTPDKPKLRDDIRRYFRSRSEDSLETK